MKAKHCPLSGGSGVSICPFEELPFYSGHTTYPFAPAITHFLLSVGRQKQLCTAFLSDCVSPS